MNWHCFLRRCYCHHIAFPTEEQMREIVKLHYREASPDLIEAALNIFYDLRKRGFEKPPATSELLNWIGALQITEAVPDKENVPLVGTLLKRSSDIQSFRDHGKHRRTFK